MTYQDYRDYLVEADDRMKSRNGHQFVTILKTCCVHCGASPKVKTRCRGWFETFLNDLANVLREDQVIKEPARLPGRGDLPK